MIPEFLSHNPHTKNKEIIPPLVKFTTQSIIKKKKKIQAKEHFSKL